MIWKYKNAIGLEMLKMLIYFLKKNINFYKKQWYHIKKLLVKPKLKKYAKYINYIKTIYEINSHLAKYIEAIQFARICNLKNLL